MKLSTYQQCVQRCIYTIIDTITVNFIEGLVILKSTNNRTFYCKSLAAFEAKIDTYSNYLHDHYLMMLLFAQFVICFQRLALYSNLIPKSF